jgi:hypothetical protein
MGNTSVAGSYNIGAFSQNPANILSDKLNSSSDIYILMFSLMQDFSSTAIIYLSIFMMTISQKPMTEVKGSLLNRINKQF